MELNQEEEVCYIKFVDECFTENFPDFKRQNFVDSDECCKDVIDLLPSDPFEMELNIALPSDPFVIDFEINLPRDPFGMDFDIGANLTTFTGWIEDFGFSGYEFATDQATEDEDEVYNDVDGGEAADALSFALSYLGVKDLLTVERVCKSLHDAVRDETLFWKNINIDYPLSDKITNDALLQLTNRAKGTLCSLSLFKCVKITNTGLQQVLERNPGLTKLSVQGCNKISVEGLVHELKAFNSNAMHGIKRLRIGHLSGLTNDQFQEFKLLLGLNDDKNVTNYKPRFFRAGEIDLSLEDERLIDVETCVRCQQPRQVYDCPSDSCGEKIQSAKACRGCILCISRCMGCGCCLDNRAYEETFCLDPLCLDCLHRLINSSNTYLRQKASYHFFLCG